MKVVEFVIAVALLAPASLTFAQSSGMKGMEMKGGNMKGMDMGGKSSVSEGATHRASGVVKALDARKSTVTIAHGPVQSMKWPAMSMTFKVKDKALLDRLGEGKKVEFEFEQQGKDYVLTSAK